MTAYVISVEPAADFGSDHGALVVSDGGQPGQVVIERADRVVYILEEWVDRAAGGEIPWAEIAWPNPWHRILKIRGADRRVISDQVGSCGPRVCAFLFEQPD